MLCEVHGFLGSGPVGLSGKMKAVKASCRRGADLFDVGYSRLHDLLKVRQLRALVRAIVLLNIVCHLRT